MKIKFKKQDFYRCFEFPVRYYLDETRSKSNRTTGQQRGLGSVINDFFLGKLIEIGVARAIEESGEGKKCRLDFNIHKQGENHDNDPDILGVVETSGERKPRLFVEIKNVSENDRFIGLTAEQCNTMLESEIIGKDSSKLFIVYATVTSENKGRLCDVFGAYLKSEIKDGILDGFADVDEICLEIKSVISAKELMENCVRFNKGSLFYETEILGEEFLAKKAERIRSQKYLEKYVKESTLPIIMMNDYPEPREFGDFYLHGEVKLLVKKNDKSRRVYLDALSNGSITNHVLGEFKFKKGKMYELSFTTVGRNPVLSRNNIWVARRNLPNLVKDSVLERIRYIARNI